MRLTLRAEAALQDIAVWALETFGVRQAPPKAEDLSETCEEIGTGRAFARACRRLIDSDLQEDLRVTRCGQHFIVFIDGSDLMIVTDVLNVESDSPGFLVG